MSNFERKELRRSHTMADKLKNLRLTKEISVEFLAKKLDIPSKYLTNLENGQQENLPGDIYVRAWLKKIANFYAVDVNSLLLDYQLEKKVSHKINRDDGVKKKAIKSGRFLSPKILRWLVVSGTVLILFIYLFFEIINIISPPHLNITQPYNNFRTKESSIEIIGQSKPEAQVMINGEMVSLDQEGKFKKTVNLTLGLNNLEISAKKKHSQTKYLEVLILREVVE